MYTLLPFHSPLQLPRNFTPSSPVLTPPSSLGHDSWLTMLVQLVILNHVVQTADSTLWRDQLAYLASPESQPLCPDLQCKPVRPHCITNELWNRLLSAPLSTDYLIRSTTFPSFWEAMKVDTIGKEASFPWRDPNTPLSLDDLVMMNLLSRGSLLARLMEETGALVGCIHTESLSVTKLLSGFGNHKTTPILFIFDHTSVASQTCLWYLEAELRKYLKASMS